MPSASMSNVTSICGTPFGAGGIPVSSNFPSGLLCFVCPRSPSKTWIRTAGWLSDDVENLGIDQLETGKDRKAVLHLALLCGDDSIALDHGGEDTAGGFDAEGEGVDIDEDDACTSFDAGEDASLDGCAIGNCLIRVDPLGRLFSEIILQELLDFGDTSRSANQNDLMFTINIKIN